MSVTAPAGTPIIEVEGLTKRYAGSTRPALAEVSLELRRGEVLGLLGPNGAGKTTLVEVLAGFRQRDAGVVRVLGLDPGRRADQRVIRSRLGLVLQHTAHHRFLTVRETLQLHHDLHEAARPVDEVLDLVGLAQSARRRVRQLSGGQLRRLDVAAALIGRPDILFLDEPTTGFDPAARQRAWDLIGSLAKLGTSIILTSHYMEEVQRLADRVVLLRDGTVHAQGTPGELAAQLVAGSLISCALPEDLLAGDLPPELRSGWSAGRLELRAAKPARVLAMLGGWAMERGLGLEDLTVTAPDLDDVFLALASDGEHTGVKV